MERAAAPSEGRHARLAVVGNPDNRRVRLFAEAAARAGLAAPRVVPWLNVLTGGGARFADDEVVRLDSPGEHPEVDRLLRGAADPTRVEGGARWYAGLLAAVRSLRGGVRLDDPDELAVLFDKRRCHHLLAGAGVPVPDSPTSGGAAEVRGWDDVRALMRAHRMPRVFLKPAHGSSASGVVALETAGGGRVKATTAVESDGGRLHNSLRVRRITAEREVAALVDALAPEGLHIERWLPKASAGGRAADLRVVVVAGRATHAVLRTSRWPMTNLHLGGTRGDLAAATDAAGPAWAEALRICERAAACFPGTLAVGVDLLPAIGWRRFAVAEVNAFGDLLPRLTGLPGGPAEGLDTYAAQLAALTDPGSRFPTPLRGHVPPAARHVTAEPTPPPAPAPASTPPSADGPERETAPPAPAGTGPDTRPRPRATTEPTQTAAEPARAPARPAPYPSSAAARPRPAVQPDTNGPSMNEPDTNGPDMNEVVGRDDLLLVTLDTLRYDVAVELAAQGRIPNLARHLPGGVWERRHAPGSFTYASHQAMFAGFLPTPAVPGPHPRLFAARFAGSESTAGRTWVFDTPDLVSGLAAAGYHTVCVGGVGFFNRAGALGGVLPGLFAESHWEPEFGVASRTSFESQVRRAEEVVAAMPPERRLFLFVNVSALHQPNWFHLPGADRASGDTRRSHAAALEYVDRHIGRLLAAASSRRRCFAIVCSDHGTAYGDDGWTGHRIGHEAVWTVPYAHFFLEHREVSA